MVPDSPLENLCEARGHRFQTETKAGFSSKDNRHPVTTQLSLTDFSDLNVSIFYGYIHDIVLKD